MIFNIFIFIFGALVGWYIHIYSTYLQVPQKIIIEKNITKTKVVYKECKELKKIERNIKIATKKRPSFKEILNSDFQKALELYTLADEEQKNIYRTILEEYFKNSPRDEELIQKIQKIIDEEANPERFLLILSKVYIDMDKLDSAIEILLELQGILNIEKYLSNTIDKYINRLLKNKQYSKLISFLEEIINQDIDTQKYTIELSKVYLKLEYYQKATEIIKDNIDEDSIYYKRAQNILKKIKENPNNRYRYKIPLIKIGKNQYGVDARINDIPIRLLIDTGATLTLIDSSFIASNNISKDIILNTAGGLIVANSAFVDLEIDKIVFNNFKITTTPFSQHGINGLLGMDFFMNFDFKIDQDDKYLYLKEKP